MDHLSALKLYIETLGMEMEKLSGLLNEEEIDWPLITEVLWNVDDQWRRALKTAWAYDGSWAYYNG